MNFYNRVYLVLWIHLILRRIVERKNKNLNKSYKFTWKYEGKQWIFCINMHNWTDFSFKSHEVIWALSDWKREVTIFSSFWELNAKISISPIDRNGNEPQKSAILFRSRRRELMGLLQCTTHPLQTAMTTMAEIKELLQFWFQTVGLSFVIYRFFQIFTARIRRMGEGNVLSLFTSGGGGQSSRGGQSTRGGGPQSSQQGGSVQPAGGGQSSRRGGGQSSQWGGVRPAGGGQVGGGVSQDRTYYTAGGMPLAFTQEDFLVLLICSAQKLLSNWLRLRNVSNC